MEPQTIKQICLTLMETADAAYFSTIDQSGFPDTRAMLNLRNLKQYPTLVQFFSHHQEDLLVYFSTNTSSEKVRQITENSAGSVYFCKPKKFQGIMLSGSVEVVSDVDIKQALWQDGWTMYYPGGVEDPDYAVLRLTPEIVKGWYKMNRFKLELREAS
jgi:general stress protein 26